MSVTDREKISFRAFQIWEAEGRPTGRDLEHWLQAEIELNVLPSPKKDKPVAVTKETAGKAVAAKKAPVAKAAKAAPKASAPKSGKAAAKA